MKKNERVLIAYDLNTDSRLMVVGGDLLSLEEIRAFLVGKMKESQDEHEQRMFEAAAILVREPK